MWASGRQDDAIRSSIAADTAGKVERGELDVGSVNGRSGQRSFRMSSAR
jgi:hypothetical protein